MSSSTFIWDRLKGQEIQEKVYGDTLIKWIYGTAPGQKLSDKILSKRMFSQIYGAYQSSSLSRYKIKSFIRDFEIPMEQYENGPFGSFNDFFIRRFKKGVRPFVSTPGILPAFSEGRYLAFEKISGNEIYPVKGQFLKAEDLLGSSETAKPFMGGPLFIARLCPVDYHRFHFPDDGVVKESFRVGGLLHSVNPLALQYKEDIFITNERQVSLLETKNFGRLAYIEVGAMNVGKIVQTFVRETFERGQEKGYFLFGASTVILMGEPGIWIPDKDILDKTAHKRETLIRLGEPIAHSKIS